MRVAINGFGRIGRTVFRILDKRGDVDVVAINDLFDNEALRYLLHYDTVMGPFDGTLRLEGDDLVTPYGRTRMLCERDPLKLPWNDLGIDVVVESTGIFTAKEQLTQHLRAGAKRVVLTVPAKDAIDYTVVLGVNDDGLKPEHRIISNASCTTNCLAPLAKVLHNSFGIAEGVINTVHAYTNDQRLADVPHSDWRRSRAAAENIIPTSTGAAKAVGMVLPELKGRLDGIAARVPVPDGSVVDLFVELEKSVTRTTSMRKYARPPSPGACKAFCNSSKSRSCPRTLSATPIHRFSTRDLPRSPAASISSVSVGTTTNGVTRTASAICSA